MSTIPHLITDSEAALAFQAVRLASLAETLELVPRSSDSGVDREEIRAALRALAKVGIGRHSVALERNLTPAGLAELLGDVLEAFEESPLPEHEWGPLARVLGDEGLAQLVGTSTSSLQRYRGGTRPTPDAVAARLHTVAMIVSDLAGSYNEFGIRRWFYRDRAALDGNSPSSVLTGDWSPDDVRVRQVRRLAQALLGSPAT